MVGLIQACSGIAGARGNADAERQMVLMHRGKFSPLCITGAAWTSRSLSVSLVISSATVTLAIDISELVWCR